MKLRLTLALSFERARATDKSEDAPQVDDKGAAVSERAESAPIGFALPAFRGDPFEDAR